MFFDDNVTLYTLLNRAVHLGGLAVRQFRNQLECLPRADDYEDEVYEDKVNELREQFDHDDYELHFANRHVRSRLRRNMRAVKPRPRPRVTDEQYSHDQFMTAAMAVQDNLRGHNRELHSDVDAMIRRCFQPDYRKGEDITSADVRMEVLVTYLSNLRNGEFVCARLRMLHSAWTAGFSPYGLSEEEINFCSHRLLMDDINHLQATS